jgi:hypothetical protein
LAYGQLAAVLVAGKLTVFTSLTTCNSNGNGHAPTNGANGHARHKKKHLPKVSGLRACDVALAMGHWQWTYEEAQSVFSRLQVPIAESSLKTQLAAGRTKWLPMPEIANRLRIKLARMLRAAAKAPAGRGRQDG